MKDAGIPRQAQPWPATAQLQAVAPQPTGPCPVARIARLQAAMARSRSERPARIAAQRQAALYRELACEGRA